MQVASLELSKTLYKLSGWVLVEKHWYKGEPVYNAPYGWDYPAYDLGYLLKKLPIGSCVKSNDHWKIGDRKFLAIYDDVPPAYKHERVRYFTEKADTPEDAAAMLAIMLFQQGVLKRG